MTVDIQNKSDAELVALSLKDKEYFGYLIERYESPLARYLARISNLRHEDVEDILQDVFIKVYLNLNDYDPEMKFSSWIYRIAHNQAISNFRKQKARPEKIDLDDFFFDSIVGEIDMEADIDRARLRDTIETVLTKIDRKYREVLVLKFLEEKSYQEISDILEKPMGTIATLLNRAKEQFRKQIIAQNIKI